LCVNKTTGNIEFKNKPKDLYYHFRESLQGHRFDGIAAAVQKMTEDLLVEWIDFWINFLRIGRQPQNMYFSGGVAQNVKACQAILNNTCIDSLTVLPAAGDASLSIGACFYINGNRKSEPIENYYLGPGGDYEQSLESFIDNLTIPVKETNTQEIAKLLSNGKIIARCTGNMEFGHRALGNRSILADARNINTVRKINDAIKFRDFWMPFCPTILSKAKNIFLKDQKKCTDEFMTIAFDVTDFAKDNIPAAIHNGDFTARPQILVGNRNKSYYNIVNEYCRITGIGAILNTSFNLHGEPVVLDYKDSLRVFENSELDCLILEDKYLIER